jgi:hypothetical protein
MRGVVAWLFVVCTWGCQATGGGQGVGAQEPAPKQEPTPAAPGGFSNVELFEVKHPALKGFVVVRQGLIWPVGFVTAGGELRIVQAELDTMMQVSGFVGSPKGSRVLIESHGEGHPYWTVYAVDALIAEDLALGEAPKALGILDPYPYAFSDPAWVDEDTLQFGSVSDFGSFDKELRRGKYDPDLSDEATRVWRWHLPTDTFTEVKP